MACEPLDGGSYSLAQLQEDEKPRRRLIPFLFCYFQNDPPPIRETSYLLESK